MIFIISDGILTVESQSMMRVWRDGQKKNVFIYRLFSSGSIDEKMLLRQMSKLEV